MCGSWNDALACFRAMCTGGQEKSPNTLLVLSQVRRTFEDELTNRERHSLRDRLVSFWNELIDEVRKSPSVVVLVSHGGAISSLVNQIIVPSGDVEYGPGVTPCRFWNCSLTEIHVVESGPGVIVRWADVSHLAEATHKVVNVDETAG